MWAVIKYDKKNFNLLQQELYNKLGNDIIVYRPEMNIKVLRNKKLINKTFNILGDYFFCYHKKFSNKLILNNLRYIKGLKYILDGYQEFQTDIKQFINKCKETEDNNGYISHNLFEAVINKKYKFNSGPFIEKIFKVVNFEKNKINILMGNLKTNIKKKEYFFSPV